MQNQPCLPCCLFLPCISLFSLPPPSVRSIVHVLSLLSVDEKS